MDSLIAKHDIARHILNHVSHAEHRHDLHHIRLACLGSLIFFESFSVTIDFHGMDDVWCVVFCSNEHPQNTVI